MLLQDFCKEDLENKLVHCLLAGVWRGFTYEVKVNKEAGHCHMIPITANTRCVTALLILASHTGQAT